MCICTSCLECYFFVEPLVACERRQSGNVVAIWCCFYSCFCERIDKNDIFSASLDREILVSLYTQVNCKIQTNWNWRLARASRTSKPRFRTSELHPINITAQYLALFIYLLIYSQVKGRFSYYP